MKIIKAPWHNIIIKSPKDNLKVWIEPYGKNINYDYSFMSVFNYGKGGLKQVKIVEGYLNETNHGVDYQITKFLPNDFKYHTDNYWVSLGKDEIKHTMEDSAIVHINLAKAFSDTMSLIKEYFKSDYHTHQQFVNNKNKQLEAIHDKQRSLKSQLKKLSKKENKLNTLALIGNTKNK